MKKNYKKLLYLLGLTSMLSLTACNKEGYRITNQECLENHLDEDKLQIHTLSDGSKYITDMDVLTSVREQFLKNNQILNLENINIENKYFEQLVSDTEYMYLFENSEIRKVLIWTMEQLQKIYPEHNPAEILLDDQFYRDYNTFDEISIYIPIQTKNQIYIFSFNGDSGIEECVDIDLESENIKFSKYMHAQNYSEFYMIRQSYSLSCFEKTGLNKINIDISSNYYLHNEIITEGIKICDDYDSTLSLDNGEDKIEAKINETYYEQFATLLTEAAKQDKDVNQFLEENEELLIEIFGDDYQRFIEVTNIISSSYTK